MTCWDDFPFEMERLPLDTDTADRLLAGTVSPEDAPPGYDAVASLLATARCAEVPAAAARETRTVEMLVLAARSSRATIPRSPRRSSVHRIKLAAALATAALACTTGLAFAGSLPGAAQDVASSMLAKAGISVPGLNDHAGTHPSVRGISSPDTAEAAMQKPESSGSEQSGSDAAKQKPESSSSDHSGQGKGAEISQLATTTDLTGVDKGAAISTLASGGQSQAGQHGQAGADQGSSSAHDGQATAEAASGGQSSGGADNAAVGQSHRP
jgi:hypothetical protein